MLVADLGPGVTTLVTTRADGVSTGCYASLDLALHVGDDPVAVHANRARVASLIGCPVAYADQVHGRAVIEVDALPGLGAVGEADALVTARSDLALAVLVADCVPILLAEVRAGVVGAVHAGRRGLAAGILPAAVEAMVSLGAGPGRMRAFVGPAICGSCYEVGASVQDEVCSAVPAARATTSWGTPSLDLEAGVLAQLADAGVRAVVRAGLCTVEDRRFYSYRRDGVTGRFAAVVALHDRDTPQPPARGAAGTGLASVARAHPPTWSRYGRSAAQDDVVPRAR